MTPSKKRQFNLAAGSLLGAFGAVAWIIAVVFALKPVERTRLPPVNLAPSVDPSSCRSLAFFLYEFNVRMDRGNMVLTLPTKVLSSSEVEKALSAATTMAAVCKRDIVDFCFGTGCGGDVGLTMTLKEPAAQTSVTEAIDALKRPATGAAPAGAPTVSAGGPSPQR